MRCPIPNTIHITQLYIPPLHSAGPSLIILEPRLTRPPKPCPCPRVTDKGGNHLDNPRALVMTTRQFPFVTVMSTIIHTITAYVICTHFTPVYCPVPRLRNPQSLLYMYMHNGGFESW